MITLTVTNANPQIRGGLVTRQVAPTLNDATPDSLGIVCDCRCVYRTPVFANTDLASGEFENDSSDFIYRTVLAGDTVEISLFKEGVLVSVITDDTYGLFFPLGFFNNPDQPEQALYVGFLLQWQKVLILEGPGDYEIRTDVTVLGVLTEFHSELFTLLPFSNHAAHGTVRIDAYMNSNIESSAFNFIGMDWFKSKRVRGEFGFREGKIEVENYADTSRVLHRIQDSITNEYTLKTQLVTGEIADDIIYQHLLGDRVICTNYNLRAPREYVGVKLYPSEIEKPDAEGSGKEMYEIKFTDKQPNIIARRF